ncbi:MAG: acetyl-CoA synthetase [Ruminococcaceae bacterium]|nr:acetyl-CoA synthetase [Oscillospiraceae bacterium]
MAIYEKFVGASRDDFLSLKDAQTNYTLSYNDDFNFAYDVIDVLGTEKPDKLAMVWISNDKSEVKHLTFRDMMLNSNKAANYFKYMGIKKGDKVMLTLKRSYFFWYCILGLHKIGAIVVQATDMLKGKDYVYRCNVGNIKAAVITGDGQATEYFDEMKDDYDHDIIKFVTKHKKAGEGWHDFEEGFQMASDQWQRPTGDEATSADDTMLMAFSSGTTGYPKIITHNFKYPLGHIMTGVFWHRVVDGGLHFTISDTGWLKSLWGKIYGQWFGESAVLVYDFDKFDGADILGVLQDYKVTTFCVPPTMYRMMLLNDVKSYDLSSLTHCCTAGEALNPEIYNKWLEATGHKIYEGFGQTETTLCIATIYPWTEPVPGAIGLPVPGFDVHILDSENQSCPRGTTGEISIRVLSRDRKSCGLLDTYNFSMEDTKKALHDGFYHTGDTAYRDERGLFRYVGRNDDVIKSSGYRIGPFEIESVLLEHDAVSEVAVTGVPDPIRGFAVKATIVLAKGFEPSDELTKELQTYVKTNTAPYKYPRIVEYVAELPKTFNGKIKRNAIREKDLENTLQ